MAGKLLGVFGSPDAIFNASLTGLEAQRLPAAVAQAIHSRRPLSDAAKELAQAQAAGCRLLTWDEPEYPVRLREIYDPPPLLYVIGNVDLLRRHPIAIVGARRPSPYGNQMAERLGRDLATRGLVVVTPIRAELVPVESVGHEERALLVEQSLGQLERPIYQLLGTDESRHVDELVEASGLTSSEVLATLFDLEMKGMVRQLPGKQFLKVLL
jgi:predicted Rossmann fold nucleotide-binding protein DprA/Smf involved in DNA uptake